jgi:hypothetical protein
MATTYYLDLHRISDAKQWLKIVEEETELCAEDQLLKYIFRGYVEELRFRLGLVQPYSDEINRISTLKRIVRSMDPVFDAITERSEELAGIPDVVRAVTNYLTDISLDLGWVINVLERRHLELADFFTSERKLYAQYREGRGPMAEGFYESNI